MANFSSSVKRQIRSYLGYSGGFRDNNIRLESMMDVVANQVDEAAYAMSLLTAIDTVDTALAGAGGSGSSASYGAVKQVDEVEFYDIKDGSTGTSTLSGVEYGEVLIERLRALLCVELAGRYFRSRVNGQFSFGPGL
jgi:hypothetical protein